MYEDNIRQGDVMLVPVDKLPEQAVPQQTYVLQASERHGNYHKFKPTAKVSIYETGKQKDVTSITPDMGKFIQVDETTWLYHGKKDQYVKNPGLDHTALKVPAGLYKVVIVREYDYNREEERPVID